MKDIPAPTPDFDVYVSRPETQWAERDNDSLEALYAQGYLPYSGTTGLTNIFYSARSARIILPEFDISSENRRIAKKFDGSFDKERVSDFNPDETFWELSLTYFAHKHGSRAMPRARLETILNSGLITHTTTYRSGDTPKAYILEVEDGTMAHFWFSFYDSTLARQSLGMWLMLDCVRSAKARGLQHYYLGTVYGEKALYKTNFAPLEWWGGNNWSPDIAALKHQARTD